MGLEHTRTILFETPPGYGKVCLERGGVPWHKEDYFHMGDLEILTFLDRHLKKGFSLPQPASTNERQNWSRAPSSCVMQLGNKVILTLRRPSGMVARSVFEDTPVWQDDEAPLVVASNACGYVCLEQGASISCPRRTGTFPCQKLQYSSQ